MTVWPRQRRMRAGEFFVKLPWDRNQSFRRERAFAMTAQPEPLEDHPQQCRVAQRLPEKNTNK